VGVINVAALVIFGILLLRKVVLMDRFFEARVYLITALLGMLVFFLFGLLFAYDVPDCYGPPTSLGGNNFYIRSAF
jgi:hypothetical protein